MAIECAKNNPAIQVNCVFNFIGNYKIENLEEIIQKTPQNLYLNFHPSNRKIELHLLLLQFLSKNKEADYFLICAEHSDITKNNDLQLQGISSGNSYGYEGLQVKTGKVIDFYLRQNKVNQLKKITQLNCA